MSVGNTFIRIVTLHYYLSFISLFDSYVEKIIEKIIMSQKALKCLAVSPLSIFGRNAYASVRNTLQENRAIISFL